MMQYTLSDSDLVLVPYPKKLRMDDHVFALPETGWVAVACGDPRTLLFAAEKVKQASGRNWHVVARSASAQQVNTVELICDDTLPIPDQSYTLDVTPQGIVVRASGPAGTYYGACTLCQLLAQSDGSLPTLHIEDQPDYPVRGVMIDISRDKVPTLDTLMRLTDLLSEWKINHVELYTEHTFAYRQHETVWKDASPMTGEEILKLDRYCAERFIELVPNQNSFGHMERWLKHEPYRALAEAPEGFDAPWGHVDHPVSLCPTDPASIDFLRGLYDELLPHFSSRLFNVGCDETFDLGHGRSRKVCEKLGVGRVYLDFLLKIHELVTGHGRTMMFWGDIIIKHPDLISELPGDLIALEWGYEADHPFEEDGRKFADAGIPFWVCPGTSSWNSISGRTNNCLANQHNAAVNGAAAGAVGYLNTDWGDNGHWQYLPISYPGFMAGAALSWNSENAGLPSLADALSIHGFKDKGHTLGRIACDFGNVYELIGKKTPNSTVLFHQLIRPLGDLSVVEGITPVEFERTEAAANEVINGLQYARLEGPDADIVVDEFTNAASMTILASRLGRIRLALKAGSGVERDKAAARKQLEQIISQHKRLWMARNKPGGLPDSVRRMETLLSELSS